MVLILIFTQDKLSGANQESNWISVESLGDYKLQFGMGLWRECMGFWGGT